MNYTILYKTYRNDLSWLRYSLLSLKKYISNVPEIVIYYHLDCEEDLKKLIAEYDLSIRIIPVVYDIHGYLKQMVVKCMCFEDINTEYIMIMDCDVIFNKMFDPSILIENDKIKWFFLEKSEYNQNEDIWSVWSQSTKNMTGGEMNRYYMYNGFPFLFRRKTLVDAFEMFTNIHNESYNDYCKKHLLSKNITVDCSLVGPNGKFSEIATIFEEFEYLGWFSYNYTDDYEFIEDKSILSDSRFQFWSHGGLTDDIIKKIENVL